MYFFFVLVVILRMVRQINSCIAAYSFLDASWPGCTTSPTGTSSSTTQTRLTSSTWPPSRLSKKRFFFRGWQSQFLYLDKRNIKADSDTVNFVQTNQPSLCRCLFFFCSRSRTVCPSRSFRIQPNFQMTSFPGLYSRHYILLAEIKNTFSEHFTFDP